MMQDAAGLAATYATGRRPPGPTPDPEYLLAAARIAQQAKVLKPFMEGLQAADVAVPPAVAMLFVAYRNRTLRLNGRALHTFARILPVLVGSGTPFVVFKGPVQQFLISGDPFDRAAGDIDIVVAREAFDDVTRLLTQSGYRLLPQFEHAWWRDFLGERHLLSVDAKLTPIDLHHLVQQPGSPHPRRPNWFLEQARWVEVTNLALPTLSEPAMVLLCVISIVKGLAHHEPVAAHVIDLARMTRNVAPEKLQAYAAAAKEQRLERAYNFALAAVAAMFGEARDDTGLLLPACRLLPLLFAREEDKADWPKRVFLLWILTDGGLLTRGARFGRELIRASRSETHMRRYEKSWPLPASSPPIPITTQSPERP